MIACPLSAIEGIPTSREINSGCLIYSDCYTPSVKELLIYKKRGLAHIRVNTSRLNENWEQTINEANHQLTLLGQPVLEIVRKSEEKTFSRRGLFSSLQKEGKQLAKSMTPASWKMNANDWVLRHYYPDDQFYTVDIDKDKCTFCQACFSFCAQAVFQVENESLQIEHQNCVNCRDCYDICPEEAIQIKPEIKKKENSQLGFHIGECRDCGRAFHTFQEDKRTCPVCFNRDSGWLSPFE